jgi:hypothetical protein
LSGMKSPATNLCANRTLLHALHMFIARLILAERLVSSLGHKHAAIGLLDAMDLFQVMRASMR